MPVPVTIGGFSIPLPGGGPSRAQRKRDSTVNAHVLPILQRLRQRADSALAARRRDSLAALARQRRDSAAAAAARKGDSSAPDSSARHGSSADRASTGRASTGGLSHGRAPYSLSFRMSAWKRGSPRSGSTMACTLRYATHPRRASYARSAHDSAPARSPSPMCSMAKATGDT